MMHTKLVAQVESYFAAVDRKDLSSTLAFFAGDASFTIASYQSVFRGRDTEIAGVFERLFQRYDSIYPAISTISSCQKIGLLPGSMSAMGWLDCRRFINATPTSSSSRTGFFKKSSSI